MSIFGNLKNIWRPDNYHGNKNSKLFFEGWYYKLNGLHKNLAIIPGIYFNKKNKNSHSFIQIFDGSDNKNYYIKYKCDDFKIKNNRFELKIGNNFFSRNKVILNIEDENVSANGEVLLKNLNPWPVSFLSPGIMGWYGLIPVMECYYGVVSMNHNLSGNININNKSMKFDEGKGYIEKNWGKSFPSEWIWIQSEHFNQNNTSFLLSVAAIPFMNNVFPGIAGGLFINGKFFKIATYEGACLTDMTVDKGKVQIVIKMRNYTVRVKTERKSYVLLPCPTINGMDGTIKESLDSNVEIEIIKSTKNSKEIFFKGIGTNCGLEISDNAQMLKEL